MDRLSDREQRLAALFLLLLGLALAWWGVIRPIAGGFAARADRRDLLVATYARDERLIGQLPSLTRAAAAQRAQAARFRLAAPSEAAADALLVRQLQAAATEGGGAATVETLAGAPGVARARVDSRLDPARLGALVQRLQNGAPLLVVDALAIGVTDGGGEARSGLLDVHVEVSAYYSAPAPR